MKKDINYYLSKGFDEKTACYFASGRKKPIKVKAEKDYILKIWFDNNETRCFDVKPYIEKNTIYEHLSDCFVFERVYIDDCNCIAWDINPEIDSNTNWNNKIDLSSDTCYLDSIICD